MSIEKPNYYVRLNMQNCVRILAVNGFELERNFRRESSSDEIPINHVIKNGQNSIMLIAAHEEYLKSQNITDMACNVEVRVEGMLNGERVDVKVTDIDFSGDFLLPDKSSLYKNSQKPGVYSLNKDSGQLELDAKGDTVIGKIGFEDDPYDKGAEVLSRSFTAEVPFPEWEFFSAEKIFDFPNTKEKYAGLESVVWPKVEELREVFAEKNINKVLPLFEMRSKEYDQAFYREPGQTLRELKNSIESVWEAEHPMNNKDLSLMQMYVSYDGKLVKIANAADGNGTIMYYVESANMTRSYDVYWMRKDGKWIIGR